MRFNLLTVGLLSFAGCAGNEPPVKTAVPLPATAAVVSPYEAEHSISPTTMSRVADGYELKNNRYRVVLNDQRGDVLFWGYTGKDRNMVFRRGIYTGLTGLPDSPPTMTVQRRDEQTWEFVGDDANHITWRKIYTLEKDVLMVSLMITNNTQLPLATAIQINGDLPGLRIMHHDPEQFDAVGGYGTMSLHGYNEVHATSAQPLLPTLLQSDLFHLKPGERQGYTSVWMLSE